MNGTALAESKQNLDSVTEKQIIEYLDASGKTSELTANEKKMFINIAREFGLNPFKREIHIAAYGEGGNRKCSIITGYEVYIKRAERTGKLDGWKFWTEGEGKTLKAVVEIYRKDMKYPFKHEVYYTEACQYTKSGYPREVWAKQPKFMTKKVAVGQAFRLCFPDDLGGMPYEEAEMPQEERNVTEENGHEPPPHNGATESSVSHEPEPQNGSNEQGEKELLRKAIGEILHAKDPDGGAYFTSGETDTERTLWKGAANIQSIRNQHDRLKKTLELRVKDYKPIPFGDEKPDEEYEDDVPVWGKQKEEVEIF